MKRKIAWSLIILLSLTLIWYLFIKPNDYQITFTVNTFPGTINQTIKSWDKKMVSHKPLQQLNLLNIRQKLKFGDSIIQYDWKITRITDSTSRIRVRIKDLEHSFMNKVMIPFTKTALEKRSKKNLIGFNTLLNNHIKKFKVTIQEQEIIKPTYCAYLTVKAKQADKAFEMMRDFPYLSGFIKEQGIETNGVPFLEITKWNIKNDSIEYNFCYPIIKTDSLPNHKEIKYKQFKKTKTLKAIYNGNYITSDRAWYALLDHAESNGIPVDAKPIEVFYHNPNTGGNELDWKAEIFLPIQEDE